MESETETPGTFTPPSRLDGGSTKRSTASQQLSKQNTQQQRPEPKKLLWMDREAIKEMTQCPEGMEPHYFVEIRNSDDPREDSEIDTAATNSTATPRYPVKPPREFVGEFKVTPEIHAGYAFTWFALSGAGMVMTRKLLSKVR
ncbi:hypothetical protein ACHAXS_000182 [Conticribra weissflogii]